MLFVRYVTKQLYKTLTLLWWRSVSYRNRSIDLLCKFNDFNKALERREIRNDKIGRELVTTLRAKIWALIIENFKHSATLNSF